MTLRQDFSIGEISMRSGVAVSALRFYEKKGLIKSYRTSGNQRRYDRDVLRRVSLIQVAQDVGISLAEMKRILAPLPMNQPPTPAHWRSLSKLWCDDLERRIVSLTKLKENLLGCIGCGCLTMKNCKIYNKGDHLAEVGVGAVLVRHNSDELVQSNRQ